MAKKNNTLPSFSSDGDHDKAMEFWNSYEEEVEPHHFATGGKNFGIPFKTTYRGERLTSKPKELPGLKTHASLVQKAILADKNIKKKMINGVPHIFVHRGMAGKIAHKIINSKDSKTKFKNWPISSWSTSKDEAKSFAERKISNHPNVGIVISKWMPVHEIVHSGFHRVAPHQRHIHENEQEIVFQHPEPHTNVDLKKEATVRLENGSYMPHPVHKMLSNKKLDFNSKEVKSIFNNKSTDNDAISSKIALLSHTNATPEMLMMGMKDKDLDVRQAAVSHANATPEVLMQGLKDGHGYVRKAAVSHANATPEILMQGMKDGSEYVRKAAVSHAKATPEMLMMGMKDHLWSIRQAAVSHANATPEMLMMGMNDNKDEDSWHVRQAAIQHPNATPEILQQGLRDEHWHVRQAAIQYPNATPEILQQGLRDEHWQVRKAAVSHANATPEMLMMGINDKVSWRVRQAAQEAIDKRKAEGTWQEPEERLAASEKPSAKHISIVAVRHPEHPHLFLHGVRRDSGKMNLIGGHAEHGEAPHIAAMREFNEEAGHEIRLSPEQESANGGFITPNGNINVHLFVVDCPEGLQINCHEDPDKEFHPGQFKFIDPLQYKNQLHVPAERNLLVKFLSGQLNKAKIDDYNLQNKMSKLDDPKAKPSPNMMLDIRTERANRGSTVIYGVDIPAVGGIKRHYNEIKQVNPDDTNSINLAGRSIRQNIYNNNEDMEPSRSVDKGIHLKQIKHSVKNSGGVSFEDSLGGTVTDIGSTSHEAIHSQFNQLSRDHGEMPDGTPVGDAVHAYLSDKIRDKDLLHEYITKGKGYEPEHRPESEYVTMLSDINNHANARKHFLDWVKQNAPDKLSGKDGIELRKRLRSDYYGILGLSKQMNKKWVKRFISNS